MSVGGREILKTNNAMSCLGLWRKNHRVNWLECFTWIDTRTKNRIEAVHRNFLKINVGKRRGIAIRSHVGNFEINLARKPREMLLEGGLYT